MKDKIQALQIKLPGIIKNIRQDRDEAMGDFSGIFMELNEIMISFVNIIPVLNENGVEISADIITRQLENVVNGYEQKDIILLADSLEYEIMESLQVYMEILEQIQ